MTASNTTTVDEEKPTTNDPHHYVTGGLAHAYGKYFGGEFDPDTVEVFLQNTGAAGTVPISLVYGSQTGTPSVEVLAELSSEQARTLGRELIEWASEIEE